MNAKIIEFLTTNSNSNRTKISEATGLSGLYLFNLLKKMVTDKNITIEGTGNDATYSIPLSTSVEEQGDENSSEQSVELTTKQTEIAENEQSTKPEPPKPSTPRNNNKFKWNGAEYGKGPLVRALLADYASKHQPTLKKMTELFPADLLKRFAVFQTIEKAREISGTKYDRYFFKEEHVIQLKDAKIVVCNQWTSDNIVPTISKLKELGYNIE